MDTGKCTGQTIRVDRLEKAVLVFLKTMVDLSVEYETLREKLRRSNQRTNHTAPLLKILAQHESDREKYHRSLMDLYPDWKSGILSLEEYLSLKADLNGKLMTLDSTIARLRQSIDRYTEETDQKNSLLTHFLQYRNIAKLTRPMLVELVREIRVYEGGRLEITLNFQDELQSLPDTPELDQEASEEACVK